MQDARAEVGALAAEVQQTLDWVGIRARAFEQDGQLVYQFLVPSKRGPIVVSARVALPAEVGGRIGKKIKKGLKKAVKSKAFKALAKVAKSAISIVPGGAALTTAVDAATTAARVVKAAKKGVKGARKVLKGGAVPKLAAQVKSAREGAKAAPKAAPRGLPAPKPGVYQVVAPSGRVHEIPA